MKDSQTQAPPPMHIVARGMDLTDSMNYRAQRSIGNVLHKLGQGIISTHVVLRIHKYPITGKETLHYHVNI